MRAGALANNRFEAPLSAQTGCGMADVNNPSPAGPGPTNPPATAITGDKAAPAVPGLNGDSTEQPAQRPSQAPAGTLSAEATRLLGWVTGFVLVLACGWGGLLALGITLTKMGVASPEIILGLFYVLELGLFLALEHRHWLSRLMGLHINPGSRPWVSAVLLWLLGPVLLLIRSTTQLRSAAAQAQPADVRKARGETDGTREVIETIVFVVVLVLLLKSFTAEAFVIPTGSMAETLYGYQLEVTCPTCGVKFPVNWSTEVEGNEKGGRHLISRAVCPNCRQHIGFVQPDGQPRYREKEPGSVDVVIGNSDWGSGDRVLVAKFVYDLLATYPDRLDVVVFKYPGDGGEGGPHGQELWPRTGPVKKQVPLNYIKRLIGLPGETIAIYRGKLYSLSPDKGLAYDDYEKAVGDPNLFAQLWKKEPFVHANDEKAKKRFWAGDFEIIRKKPENILAMMRPVYDNDHPARDLTGKEWQRWVPADKANWSAIEPHGFRIGPSEGSNDVEWLRYRHILRDHPPEGETPRLQLITDFMGYNTGDGPGGQVGQNWASDLILECEAVVEGPEGELILELSKGPDRFQASFDLASGDCTLFRIRGEGEREPLGNAVRTTVKGKGTYRLRLANVDEKLTLWVDNRLPFEGGGVPYKVAAPKLNSDGVWAGRGPVKKNDVERPASIGAKGAKVSVRKIKLFRDTYYTGKGSASDIDFEPWAVEAGPDPDRKTLFEKLKGADVATFYVQPGHFLCLGDNSPQSSDGRTWGLVPQRLLLGKALLVYYPFGRAGRIR
jgi:signal peptidase I